MGFISAADAVSPAIRRTGDFLFRPFRWGTFLKLGLVAIITEGFGSNFNSSHKNEHSSGNVPMLPSPFDLPAMKIAAVVAALLLALVLSLTIFYLLTRLRFAYFHCLISNTKEIRPGWWMYRDQATRFFWMNVGVGLGFLAVVILIAIPFANGIWRVFREAPPGGHPDFAALVPLILPLIPLMLLFFLLAVLADVILRDFIMPHYVLEDASAGEAWAGMWARVMAEKRQFIVYAVLRLALPFLAFIGLIVVLAIPGLVLAGSVAAVEIGLHSAFADASGGPAAVGMLLQIFFGVLGFAFAVLGGICLGGPVSTGVREYALVFYGGRYAPLGNALYPPAGETRTTTAPLRF